MNETLDDICAYKSVILKDKIEISDEYEIGFSCNECQGYNYNCCGYKPRYDYDHIRIEEID